MALSRYAACTPLSIDTCGGTEILDIGSLVAGRTESVANGIFNHVKWYACRT